MIIPAITMIATIIPAIGPGPRPPGGGVSVPVEITEEEDEAVNIDVDDIEILVVVAIVEGTTVLVYAGGPSPNVLLGIINIEYADPNVAPVIVIVGDGTVVVTLSPVLLLILWITW
jgi:hypothetical protein